MQLKYTGPVRVPRNGNICLQRCVRHERQRCCLTKWCGIGLCEKWSNQTCGCWSRPYLRAGLEVIWHSCRRRLSDVDHSGRSQSSVCEKQFRYGQHLRTNFFLESKKDGWIWGRELEGNSFVPHLTSMQCTRSERGNRVVFVARQISSSKIFSCLDLVVAFMARATRGEMAAQTRSNGAGVASQQVDSSSSASCMHASYGNAVCPLYQSNIQFLVFGGSRRHQDRDNKLIKLPSSPQPMSLLTWKGDHAGTDQVSRSKDMGTWFRRQT